MPTRESVYPDRTIDFQEANRRVNLIQLASGDASLKKSGSWYIGPCPFCGGRDRFNINTEIMKWLCRKCTDAEYKDAVDYVARRENVEVAEAARRILGKNYEPVIRAKTLPAQEPKEATTIRDALWMDRASEYVEECRRRLWSEQGAAAKTYLREQRGLSDMAIYCFRLGLDLNWRSPQVLPPTRAITIPCYAGDDLSYVKGYRADHAQYTGFKYVLRPGSLQYLFNAHSFEGALQAFIFEGEFDAMLAWQEWGSEGVGFGSFPAGQDSFTKAIKCVAGVERFLIAHDMDEAGRKSTDSLTNKYDRAKPVEFPEGINDLGDLRDAGMCVFDWLYETLGE